MIVNADSAQVYSDLIILSARPTVEEMAGIEHRLFGYRDGACPCSAADWAAEARAAIAEVRDRGHLPILVGGTGLYLRTLLQGIADVPPVDPAIREEVRSRSVAENHRQLLEVDPEAAGRLHGNDTTRVARALEVMLSSGKPLRWWQERTSGGITTDVTLFGRVLDPPREELSRAIDRRFEAMIEGGGIEEVERLLSRDLSPALPVLRAIGVREITALLKGEMGRRECIAAGQLATRQYAKRQATWFRNQSLGLARATLPERAGQEAALEQLVEAARTAAC